jgi:hypothetical protein
MTNKLPATCTEEIKEVNAMFTSAVFVTFMRNKYLSAVNREGSMYLNKYDIVREFKTFTVFVQNKL